MAWFPPDNYKVGFARNGEPFMGVTTGSSLGGVGARNYLRCVEGGTVARIGIYVQAQAGNLVVAVYRNNGLQGRAGLPDLLLSDSGLVACPAAGYAEIPLLQTVNMQAGDWFYVSGDGAATLRPLGGTVGNIWTGFNVFQAAGGPAAPSPASAGGAFVSGNAATFAFVGLP